MSEVVVDDALCGEVMPPRIRSIINHEREAVECTAAAGRMIALAEKHRWEAARLIVEELDSGKSQAQLAREIGKSQPHVHRMAKCWNLYLKVLPSERPSLNEVYNSPEVRGPASKPAVEQPREEPPADPGPTFDNNPQLFGGFNGRHNEDGPGWSKHGDRWTPNSFKPEPVHPEPQSRPEPKPEVTVTPWSAEETELCTRLEAGETVVISMRAGIHEHLQRWAEQHGLFVRIDRRSDWGNPFELPGDGDRETVIANYDQYYLPHKPSLLSRLSELRGKALGCWCAPEACHGDVLKERAER